MSFEKRGVLSLWLFVEKPESLEDSLLEDQFGVTYYNRDLLEVGGSDDWDEMPLEEVFQPMSVSNSWSAQALAAAKSHGLTKCRRAFIVLNFAYDPEVAGVKFPADPHFLGVFEFQY